MSNRGSSRPRSRSPQLQGLNPTVRGLCEKCAYPLEGLVSEDDATTTCPECGHDQVA